MITAAEQLINEDIPEGEREPFQLFMIAWISGLYTDKADRLAKVFSPDEFKIVSSVLKFIQTRLYEVHLRLTEEKEEKEKEQ